MADLQAKTGLTLTVDETGNVTYAKDEKGKAIVSKGENGKNVGSKAARKELMKMVNSEQTITVMNETVLSTRVKLDDAGNYTNTILINSSDIDNAIANTSKDMNSTTFGYALTFFHERGHTLYGGGKDDPRYPQTEAGPNETLPNKIRRQLGQSSYGQRVIYAQVLIKIENKTYMAFSHATLTRLQNQQSPTEKYILIEDFNKK